jgi:hypothetical protein
MSTFEDRLWSQLVAEHERRLRAPSWPVAPSSPVAPAIAPTRHNHRRRLLTSTALATAALVTALALALGASTSTPPAYAVTTNRDGTVTVTLDDVAAITGLNAELTRDGIAATAIPITADCPFRGFPNAMPAGTDPSTYTITIVPREIPAGYTAVVAVGQSPSGQIELAQGAFPSPPPACFNSTPLVLHPIDMAHASPALRAAMAKARRAAQAAAQR